MSAVQGRARGKEDARGGVHERLDALALLRAVKDGERSGESGLDDLVFSVRLVESMWVLLRSDERGKSAPW
jgi:hypothetical protein